MTTDSMAKENFSQLHELYQNQLSFISPEDRIEIVKLGADRSKIWQLLVKYKDIISGYASEQNLELKTLANHYINLILKGVYYEGCLKAASEFDIPLVVVDREYCFKKVLAVSQAYSDETKSRIIEFYDQINVAGKSKLMNLVVQGADIAGGLPQGHSID